MAAYFWVGGTGTWNNTNSANWSLTSGGAGGAGVPTSADTVTINVNSGTGTISVDSTATCGGVSFTSTVTILRLIADVTLMPSTATFTHSFGTINLNNFNLTVGIWSSSNSNTRQVQFGTGQIRISGSGATILSMGTMTSWSYTGTPIFNLIYSGSIGTRTISIGATSGALENQVPSLYVSAGSDIISTGNSYFKDLNFVGFIGTLTTGASVRFIYGNLVFGTGMTITSSIATFVMAATSGNYNITSNSVVIPVNFSFGQSNTPSTATWTLTDNLSMGTTQRQIALLNGTLNANNKNVTIGNLSTGSGSNTFTLNMGSGTWSLFSPGVVWDVTTYPITLTLNANTSTIVTTYSITAGVTLNMGSYTYNNLTIGGTGGSNTVTINGGPTINTFTSIKPVLYTLAFEAGKTTTFNKFSVFGSSGKNIVITSTTTTPATLKQRTGIVSGNFLNINYITGDPSANWYMGSNSTSTSGNNTNIKFANPPWGNGLTFFN